MILIDSTNPVVEFFKQISNILGAGLPGLAAIMIIVIGFVVIKMKNKKGVLIAFIIFCAFILVFFTYAGVGVVKQNNQLSDSTMSLKKTNLNLDTNLKASDQKLTIANTLVKIQQQQNKIQQKNNAVMTAQDKDTLLKSIDTLVSHIDTYKTFNKNYSPSFSKVATQYIDVSKQLKNNTYSANQAQEVLLQNNRNLNRLITPEEKLPADKIVN